MHSLLHSHFESALRALAVACPGDIRHARAAFESRAYARTTPAGRLSLLDRQVARLTHGCRADPKATRALPAPAEENGVRMRGRHGGRLRVLYGQLTIRA